MSDPVKFLTTLGQALATMNLYADGHPARERGGRTAFEHLEDLLTTDAGPRFTFLEGEIVYENRVVRELRDWDWAAKLSRANIQRLEILNGVTFEEFERFLHDVSERLAGVTPATLFARQQAPTHIRFGSVSMKGSGDLDAATADLASGPITYSLEEEIEAIRMIHEEVSVRGTLPLMEAEAVVRSLALAMHTESDMVLPLLELKEFDQYTTTHCSNVAVLSMALAEHLGLGSREVRALGVAGLLHDLGKVRIPKEVLTKPGRLTPEERTIIETHPVEGAKIILAREQHLDLAAVVAYEHHLMLDGRGYPRLHYARPAHHASQIVHVCDVFDALCTHRPYREAWATEAALALLEEESGTSFVPDLVEKFAAMLRSASLHRIPLENPTIRLGGVA